MAKEKSVVENEMEILLAGDTVKLGDKEVVVTPYSWADTFRLAKPFGVIFSLIATYADPLINALSSAEESSPAVQVKALADFVASINEAESAIDALADMVEKSTNLTKEEVLALPSDDFLTVAMSVYEVNKHFFTKRLAPKIKAMQEK